jgi:hypothetical protein
MVLAIGFFLKIWPDATMSDANYARRKRWLASFAAIFAVIFLVLLASMREVSDTLTLTASAENPGGGTFSYKAISNFLFQISLLLSLIFAASFFAHWRRTSPKKLMRAMSLEGRALLSMYDADPYFYGKKRSDYDDLIRGISSRKSAREIFQKKLSYYSGKKLSLLKKEACVAIIDGTISPPQTDAKKRANDNAQRILAQLSGNKGSS